RRQPLLVLIFFLSAAPAWAQIEIEAKAFLNVSTKTISVDEEVHYTNTSTDTLYNLYFNDWINAFKSKVSPLGKHFSTQYIKRFHFSQLSERGETRLDFIRDEEGREALWSRPEGHPDIIGVQLKNPLPPGKTRYL